MKLSILFWLLQNYGHPLRLPLIIPQLFLYKYLGQLTWQRFNEPGCKKFNRHCLHTRRCYFQFYNGIPLAAEIISYEDRFMRICYKFKK